MQVQSFEYQDGQERLKGYIAQPAQSSFPKPTVLVMHDWSGCNEFAKQKASALAELGYIGIALDIYGEGKVGESNEEKAHLMKPFIDNRARLRQRLLAGFEAASHAPNVDRNRMAAIGFCFGGLCALDLARSGASVRGVISFHGLLGAPESVHPATITTKVLVLHGYNDPMGMPSQVMQFADEMTKAEVDWQIHLYGHTMHAFTNPQAKDEAFGTVYDATADKRSWASMQQFLKEIFV